MYLQYHHGQWRVRRIVPPALVDKIGKLILLEGTGTADFDRAQRVAAPIIRKHDRLLAQAAGKRNGPVNLKYVGAGSSIEWYTPPFIFEAMPGVLFDLDVASPGRHIVPWIPAPEHIISGSLEREWRGFIWMNPPFGLRRGMQKWIDKLIQHGNGIAMLPANSYVKWWQHTVQQVDAVLFVSGYVNAISPTGRKTRTSFGTCLFACGERGVAALRTASANGLGTMVEPRVAKKSQ
jgi:hypothetical protein